MDHNAVTPVRLKPAASQFWGKHSTTEPLRDQDHLNNLSFQRPKESPYEIWV